MQKRVAFQVYNASAGSGKTYTIAKEYLQIVLSSQDPNTFQKILAITFTNKAAHEMKERVLGSLKDLANGKKTNLILDVQSNLSIDFEVLAHRAEQIVEGILRNYSAFSITTIDSFTHQLIKSFAFDLKLPLNFDVELQPKALLNEAVEQLIAKIGTDNEVTDFLIEFSITKANDDKSWDISRELNQVAEILLKENDIPYIKALSEKNLTDFIGLKRNLEQKVTLVESQLKKIGTAFGLLLDEKDVKPSDFIRSSIPNFFRDIAGLPYNSEFWRRFQTIEKALETHNFYKKNTATDIANTIDSLAPIIDQSFRQCRVLYGQLALAQLFLKNLNPLGVLTNIYQELNEIKQEKGIQFNSEFNRYIADSIKGQPAPYIYEKLGQRYQYFFIDEMQDTSLLQWQNLVPLLQNALAQEHASLFLVGDAKQSIYRWRGSEAEQFIALGSPTENDFQVQKQIQNLPKNFRSFSEIIEFNNAFFSNAADFFKNPSYAKLYREENQQEINNKEGGYVSIKFIGKKDEAEEKSINFAKQTYEIINRVKDSYNLNEICVLVRKNKEGVDIANHLSEQGIAIVSSESLLIENSAKVKFVVAILRLLINPDDKQVLFDALYFLSNHLPVVTEKHRFLSDLAQLSFEEVITDLENLQVYFNLAQIRFFSLYDKVEEIVREFRLMNQSDAHLQFFLDIVLNRQKKGDDLQGFLEFWDLRKEKLSISSPSQSNAVNIMTIHKAKGLEFPVVIFPCDVEIYKAIQPKTWMNPAEINEEFPDLMVDINQSLSNSNALGSEIYEIHRSQMELDNINLLYVAFTRAVEKLFIVSSQNGLSKNGDPNLNYFSGLFINFLQQKGLWKDIDSEYEFGKFDRKSEVLAEAKSYKDLERFASVKWQEHQLALLDNSSKLWNTPQGEAIEYGNLVHQMLSDIYTFQDIPAVVRNYANQGFFERGQEKPMFQLLENVVRHPRLAQYFTDEFITWNEREFINGPNQIVKPDKVVVKNNKVVIIDYKTGQQENKHRQQINSYAAVFEKLDYKIEKKLVVYINQEILVKEVE